jgi:small subunit ribosomal protein S17
METTTNKQTFTGTVVKTAMKDTATVAVDRYVKHPKYKKFRTLTKKYLVHDAGNTAKVGDTVTIVSCRPLSKLKRFTLKSIDKTAAASE